MDYENQRITNGKGEYVEFSQPIIEEYIAFHYTNIAELKAEIDELEISNKKKARLLKYFIRINLEKYHEKFSR